MVLTDKQKHELHQAMLEYMMSEGDRFAKSIAAFSEEAVLDTAACDSGKGILEKKWTAVIRLQKKVLELEAKVGSRLDGESNRVRPGGGKEDSKGIPKGPSLSSLSGHRGPVVSVTVHPVYSLVASGSEDCTVKLWDYESAQYERTLKGHTGAVTALTFSPSTGAVLASVSADMSAKLWDMTTFQCTKTLRGHDHTLSGVCFSSSGDHLYTCSRDQTVRCWEVASGFCIRTLSGHTEWVKCVTVSMDGALVASGSSDHNVIVWRAETGAAIQTLRGHEHVVESVAIGPLHFSALVSLIGGKQQEGEGEEKSTGVVKKTDAVYLVSGSRDRTVRLWDPLKAHCLAVYSSHENW
eukprot:CAMPEP_0185027146 /NCGR_PEP_ID=MMETSP1103-20130426/11935_1 /TAXON_ID=36769 /ORGANISM="Paraphysomonas bandaiensis, Strain Caron Lab Isolate" /LENGTH=351 /DNA_ID=CAMNT_0027561015 /DNA_START=111 /DNA_END=1163 /DNA_ORIENTATION=-